MPADILAFIRIAGLWNPDGGTGTTGISITLPKLTRILESFQDDSQYVGRPTPLLSYQALKWWYQWAQIYLKREDLNHTGAHKVNNTIGQALLAKMVGKNASLPRQAEGNMA